MATKHTTSPRRRKKPGLPPGPTPETREALERAAILRANGQTWDRIAATLGRTTPGLQSLVDDHTAYFKKHFHEVIVDEFRLMEVLGLAAAVTLAELLNSKDEKVQESAAHSLLSNRAKLWAQVIKHTGNVEVQLYSKETPIEALGPPPKPAPQERGKRKKGKPPAKPTKTGRKK